MKNKHWVMNSITKRLIKNFFPHIYLKKFNRFMDEKIKLNKKLRNQSMEENIVQLHSLFKKKVGYDLNLDNPSTYNEKIQWLKIYDSTDLKSDWTDKIIAKEFAAKIIGQEYIVPLLQVVDAKNMMEGSSSIDYRQLPNQFVIKTNHGSGNCIIVKDKTEFLRTGGRIIAETQLRRWLEMDYGFDDGFELHYSKICRKVFVEKYIPALSNITKEYRIFCFNGQPAFIEVKSIYNKGNSCRNLYYPNWTKINVIFHYPQGEWEERPKLLDKMLSMARQLSKDFILVRVDFNCSDKQIYFGELTFTPNSGFHEFTPKSFDVELGRQIKLNNNILQ